MGHLLQAIFGRGKPRPIEEWYRQYGEAVLRRCRRILRSESLAEDALQETFVRAHRYQHTYREEGKPMSWLFTIADRVCFDSLKKTRQEMPVDGAGMLLEAEERPDTAPFIQHDVVRHLLADANDVDRQILVHRYFDELTYDDIALKVEMSERQVRRRHGAIVASLRAKKESYV